MTCVVRTTKVETKPEEMIITDAAPFDRAVDCFVIRGLVTGGFTPIHQTGVDTPVFSDPSEPRSR